jgi:protein SCO1/2
VTGNTPPVALVDQHGGVVRLSEFRGPAILVFAFGHCATVCPGVVHDMLAARRSAGRPDVPLFAITFDPWRDTPDRLPTIARTWGLDVGDRVLSGSVADVERVLDAFSVSRQRDERTGDVAHVPTTLLLDGDGRIAWRIDGGWAGDAMRKLLKSERREHERVGY